MSRARSANSSVLIASSPPASSSPPEQPTTKLESISAAMARLRKAASCLLGRDARYQARRGMPTNCSTLDVAERSRNSHIPPMAELVIRRGLEEPDTSESFKPHKPARPEKSMGGRKFELVSDYQPAGDQPTAIRELVASAKDGEQTQVLLGVTGSGKTFTMAKVIEELQRPA